VSGCYQERRGRLTLHKTARQQLLTPVQKKVGVLPKDASSGPFVDEWKRAYGDISKEVEEVDIAPALSQVAFSIKSQEELVCAGPLYCLLLSFTS
jgi:nucleosome binding factor SPN SPT16 subunit